MEPHSFGKLVLLKTRAILRPGVVAIVSFLNNNNNATRF